MTEQYPVSPSRGSRFLALGSSVVRGLTRRGPERGAASLPSSITDPLVTGVDETFRAAGDLTKPVRPAWVQASNQPFAHDLAAVLADPELRVHYLKFILQRPENTPEETAWIEREIITANANKS